MNVDEPNPIEFLTAVATSPSLPSSLKSQINSFISLYNKKLFHPLTLSLLTFQKSILSESKPEYAALTKEGLLVKIFEGFIRKFAKSLNPLRLVELGTGAAREFADPSDANKFLLSVLTLLPDNPSKSSPEAYVLITATTAQYHLLSQDFDTTKSKLSECQKILDTLDGPDKTVLAEFYRVSGDFHKVKADYGAYYRTSLLYLSCLPKPLSLEISEAEIVQRAHDIGISALLAETVYNFGELLLHPIFTSLNSSTPYEWLKNLLLAFNAGDIGKFEALSPYISREPILQDSYGFLRQKICLMSLIESVFKRKSRDRVIPFEDIAAETTLKTEEVEYMLMKALSLKLINGSIDQVLRVVSITWVQPRVLNKDQISGLRDRLLDWVGDVDSVGKLIDSAA